MGDGDSKRAQTEDTHIQCEEDEFINRMQSEEAHVEEEKHIKSELIRISPSQHVAPDD